MQSLLNNMCFYNIWQRSRRVCLRAIGLIVALFSSTHARAYLSTACPWCSQYSNSICDMSTAEGYSDGHVYGSFVQACIPAENKGVDYPQIQDSTCVEKLQAIGMCDGNEGGSTVSFLYQSGLNCTSGVTSTPDYYTYYCGYTYQTKELAFNVVQMAAIDNTSYPYICCDLTCGYDGSYNCCVSPSSCIMPMVCGYGACPSGYYNYMQLYSDSATTDGVISCTAEFQEYFSATQNSTGWCDPTTGKIIVEGTGALLISHFCYGTDYISQYGNLIQFFCGLIIEGCENANGYYVNKILPGDPMYYGTCGYSSSDYCPKCPTDVSGYSSDHNFTITADSSAQGITSCRATAGNPTVSDTDTTGTFDVIISGACPYLHGDGDVE